MGKRRSQPRQPSGPCRSCIRRERSPRSRPYACRSPGADGIRRQVGGGIIYRVSSKNLLASLYIKSTLLLEVFQVFDSSEISPLCFLLISLSAFPADFPTGFDV